MLVRLERKADPCFDLAHRTDGAPELSMAAFRRCLVEQAEALAEPVVELDRRVGPVLAGQLVEQPQKVVVALVV